MRITVWNCDGTVRHQEEIRAYHVQEGRTVRFEGANGSVETALPSVVEGDPMNWGCVKYGGPVRDLGRVFSVHCPSGGELARFRVCDFQLDRHGCCRLETPDGRVWTVLNALWSLERIDMPRRVVVCWTWERLP